ncbi:choice-of-anchor H family protein [Alteromonas oceanisediminis]|uniref:choice-of-anchor H family protein n=1 Tax=Alteromonas oceanisediminis TaxID=2836180 RepID=UPI001BD92C44|nr:choice-of-anchor H family protein [Alteromonas oceanisediminis]MBT0585427.1 choice-of-anchor H family protein [Alteromonas oceanisediminis]
MKYVVCLFVTACLLSMSASAAEKPSPESQVNSAEFQFGVPFTSPDRETQNTRNWLQKNVQLGSREPAIVGKEREAIPANTDFWIFDSWVSLTNDIDYDGYHSSITVEFDADTVYHRAYVYAILYLSRTDVYESYHVTSVFAIDGDASTDSFVVESSLLQGYPSDEYDILIELYDADTDELVAFTDAYDDADLAFAPLESENYEYVETTVVYVEEHGGSVSTLLALLLAVSAYRMRVRLRTVQR